MGPPEEEEAEDGKDRLSIATDGGVERDELSLIEHEIVDNVGGPGESLFGVDHSVINETIRKQKHKERSEAEDLVESNQDVVDLAKTFQQFQKELKIQKSTKSKSTIRREGSVYRGELDEMRAADNEHMEYHEEDLDFEDDMKFDDDADEFEEK